MWCGKGATEGATLSLEHITKREYPTLLGIEEQSTEYGISVRHPGGQRSERTIPASPWDAKAKVCCRECNSESDRRIEGPVRDLVIELAQFKPPAVPEGMQRPLITWALRTLLVCSAARRGHERLPGDLARHVWRHLAPRPGAVLLQAFSLFEDPYTYETVIADADEPTLVGVAGAIGIGGMLLVVADVGPKSRAFVDALCGDTRPAFVEVWPNRQGVSAGYVGPVTFNEAIEAYRAAQAPVGFEPT